MPIPSLQEFTYRLAVVSEAHEVLKWASKRHTVVLPNGLEEGAIGEASRTPCNRQLAGARAWPAWRMCQCMFS